MIEMYNKTLKETIYKEILDNGLTVYLCRKKDYKLKQAIFSVDFGGNASISSGAPRAFV